MKASGTVSRRASKFKKHAILALIPFLTATAPVLAMGHLEAKLFHTTPAASSGSELRVLVRLSNTGNEDVSIYRPFTPFGRLNDRPGADMFEVRDAYGHDVEYRGWRDYWGPPTIDYFMVIRPGEVMEKELDLTDMYDFKGGGLITLRYVIPTDQTPEPNKGETIEKRMFHPNDSDTVVSNPITVLPPAYDPNWNSMSHN